MQDWTATTIMELQEKKHKKIKAYRKSVYKKQPKVKRCMLILDLKPFRS